METQTQTQETQIVKLEPTPSEKFALRIQREFQTQLASPLAWGPLEMKLAQHLFVKVDAQLKALEVKRASNRNKSNDPPIVWDNVNMPKLAIDASHRIDLRLDAAIPNHIHVIPYLNGKTKKYDIDLQIGYTGVAYVREQYSVHKIVDIWYQLVCEGDEFRVETDPSTGGQRPHYVDTNPMEAREITGGFGYIRYEDERKNRVYVVTKRDLEKAQAASRGTEFWGGEQTKWVDNKPVNAGFDEKYYREMCRKTVMKRVAEKIQLDPTKVNQTTLDAIEMSKLDATEAAMDAEIVEHANTGDVMTFDSQEGEQSSGGSDSTIIPPAVAEVVQQQQAAAASAPTGGQTTLTECPI